MYNGPQDVSGNVDGMSGIKFALGISRNDNTNIEKLIFLKSGYIYIYIYTYIRIYIWIHMDTQGHI